MDWKAIIGSAAPILGSVIGGPAGGAAMKLLADGLLGDEDASEEQIAHAIATDPNAAIKLKEIETAYLLKIEQIQLERDKGQMEINKIESKSPSFYKGGWRPAVGWTCVAGLAYSQILYQFLVWIAAITDNMDKAPPNIDPYVLITLLGGLLGIGGLRTYERYKGVEKL